MTIDDLNVLVKNAYPNVTAWARAHRSGFLGLCIVPRRYLQEAPADFFHIDDPVLFDIALTVVPDVRITDDPDRVLVLASLV